MIIRRRFRRRRRRRENKRRKIMLRHRHQSRQILQNFDREPKQKGTKRRPIKT